PTDGVAGSGIEVEPGGFVNQTEDHACLGVDVSVVAANEPEMGVADRDSFVNVGVRAGKEAVGAVGNLGGENVIDIASGAFDGLVGGLGADAIIGGAELEVHRIGEIEREGDEAEGDPEDDDEDGGGLAAGRAKSEGRRPKSERGPKSEIRIGT